MVTKFYNKKSFFFESQNDSCLHYFFLNRKNKSQESVTELLLKNGADINDEDNSGETPLSIAAINGNIFELSFGLNYI